MAAEMENGSFGARSVCSTGPILTAFGDAIETRPNDSIDGSQWVIKPMSTYNMSVDYRFDTFADSQARARFGVINFTDARAPLSSNRFGYFSDMHRDYGRAFYFDLRLDF